MIVYVWLYIILSRISCTISVDTIVHAFVSYDPISFQRSWNWKMEDGYKYSLLDKSTLYCSEARKTSSDIFSIWRILGRPLPFKKSYSMLILLLRVQLTQKTIQSSLVFYFIKNNLFFYCKIVFSEWTRTRPQIMLVKSVEKSIGLFTWSQFVKEIADVREANFHSRIRGSIRMSANFGWYLWNLQKVTYCRPVYTIVHSKHQISKLHSLFYRVRRFNV